MKQNYCKNCAYFHQHYALNRKQIFRVYCGHCSQPKIRRKSPDTVACEYFEMTEPDEYAFVTKEYLSKELLQYLLQLDLLPTIEE